MSDYNYEHFDTYVRDGLEQAEFSAFPGWLRAGEAAPDATLTRLADGAEVRLSSLWTSETAVLEFGSFT